MAYVPQLDEEEKKKELEQPTVISTAPATPSAPGGAGETAVPSATESQPQAYVAPQQIAAVNEPAREALLGRVRDYFTKQAGEATTALETAQPQFQQAVAGGTPSWREDVYQNIAKAPSAKEIETYAPEYQKMLGASYGGPESFERSSFYKPVGKEVGDVTSIQRLAPTAAGQMDIMAQMPGFENLSRGSLAFNQALLAANPEAFQQTLGVLSGVAPAEQAARDAAMVQVKAAQEAAQGVRTKATEAIKAPITQLEQQINSAVEAKRQELTQKQNALSQALTSGGALSQDQLKDLNLTQSLYDDLVSKQASARQYGGGVNLSGYLTTQRPDVVYTPGTVTSAEDAARYSALANLAGQEQRVVTPESVSVARNPFGFNSTEAAQALQQQIDTGSDRQRQAGYAQQQQQAMEEAGKPDPVMGILSGAAQGASIGAAVFNGPGAIIGGIIGAIAGLFGCFTGGTPILMADGTVKNVEDLEIGDNVSLGGVVTAVGISLCDDLWWYRGAFVSGSHVVFHEGKWADVSSLDGQDGVKKVILEGGTYARVYPIVCANHILLSGDFVSADFALCDDPFDMTEADRIDYLNGWTERNNKLQGFVDEVQGLIKANKPQEATHAVPMV